MNYILITRPKCNQTQMSLPAVNCRCRFDFSPKCVLRFAKNCAPTHIIFWGHSRDFFIKPSGIDILTSVRDRDRDLVKTLRSVQDRDQD
jgi:hypothetical protein